MFIFKANKRLQLHTRQILLHRNSNKPIISNQKKKEMVSSVDDWSSSPHYFTATSSCCHLTCPPCCSSSYCPLLSVHPNNCSPISSRLLLKRTVMRSEICHHGSCACSSHFASGTAQHNKKRTSQLGLFEIERTPYCFNYCYTIVTLHNNWKVKIPFVRKIAGLIFNVIQQVLSTKKVYGPWDLRQR